MSEGLIGLIIVLVVIAAAVIWHFLPKKDKREVRNELKTRAEILKEKFERDNK